MITAAVLRYNSTGDFPLTKEESIGQKEILGSLVVSVTMWNNSEQQKVSHEYRCSSPKKYSDESGEQGGQVKPQQHIHQVCILEQDMSEVICHENSAMYFLVSAHTLDWTGGKKKNTATQMMLSCYIQTSLEAGPQIPRLLLVKEMICRWELFVLVIFY